MTDTPRPDDDLDFAQSPAEALKRAEQWQSKDPFPGIRPALLNSADIADYVRVTAMIHPFFPERLKSASYPIRLCGDALYWDSKGKKVTQTITEGAKFTLPKNAIAFVTLEPHFHLPDYIAARFNLKIPNVYRGLLLGTGPLVDPGWAGRLSIPLHNLTTNDYEFVGGDELIWMEFTKLSENERWTDHTLVSPPRRGVYVEFPAKKRGGDVQTRVATSAPNTAVSSSLAGALTRADDAARSAKQAERTARSLSTRYTIAGGIAAVIGLATIVALAVQVLAFDGSDQGGSQPSSPRAAEIQKLRTEVSQLQTTIANLRARVGTLEKSRRTP